MRLVLAEDNTLLCDGLALVLADHSIDVVGAVDDGTGLLVAVERKQPDLAIVDVRMPPTFTGEGIRAALDNQAIADRLILGLRSVEKNVASIFTKLDLAQHPDDHRRLLAVLRHLEGARRAPQPEDLEP